MSHWISLAASVIAASSAQPFPVPGAAAPAVSGAVAPGGEVARAVEEEWAEEAGAAALEHRGLAVRVDAGRAPAQAALRLTLEGAAPHQAACLELGFAREGGLANAARQVVCADSEGRVECLLPGPLPPGIGARFALQGAAGGAGGALRTPVLALPSNPPLPISAVQRGDLVITEIMKDPAFVTDAHGEWFEIVNVSSQVKNLAGWRIADLGSNLHTLTSPNNLILVQPGQHFVLGNDSDPLTNGGVHVDYEYAGFTLGNAADSILLIARSGILVDQVDYDDGIFWPDVPGASLTLNPFAADATLNDDPAYWCAAQSPIGGGNPDLGTPALFNELCP